MTSNNHASPAHPNRTGDDDVEVSPFLVLGLCLAVVLWPLALPLVAAYLAVRDALGQ